MPAVPSLGEDRLAGLGQGDAPGPRIMLVGGHAEQRAPGQRLEVLGDGGAVHSERIRQFADGRRTEIFERDEDGELPIIDPQRPERFIEAAAYDPPGPLDALAQAAYWRSGRWWHRREQAKLTCHQIGAYEPKCQDWLPRCRPPCTLPFGRRCCATLKLCCRSCRHREGRGVEMTLLYRGSASARVVFAIHGCVSARCNNERVDDENLGRCKRTFSLAFRRRAGHRRACKSGNWDHLHGLRRTDWEVQENGDVKGARDLSGIACAEASGFPRHCLVVDDEAQSAQFVVINDGRIVAGDPVPLTGNTEAGKPLEFDGEGVGFENGAFYVIGSHGHPRDKGQTKDRPEDKEKIAKRIDTVSVIQRIEIQPADTAGAWPKTPPTITRSTALHALLAADKELYPFVDQRLEKNGLTIEGVAVRWRPALCRAARSGAARRHAGRYPEGQPRRPLRRQAGGAETVQAGARRGQGRAGSGPVQGRLPGTGGSLGRSGRQARHSRPMPIRCSGGTAKPSSSRSATSRA